MRSLSAIYSVLISGRRTRMSCIRHVLRTRNARVDKPKTLKQIYCLLGFFPKVLLIRCILTQLSIIFDFV